jgi:phosphoribosylglycinamide formyltransferase-1
VKFPLDRPARLAVLASGRGSNLLRLIEAFPPGDPLGQVVLAVSDQPGALALSRANERGIEAVYLPWPRGQRRAAEEALDALLKARGIDLVLLAGFMRLLSAEFVAGWYGAILNIHPSLLPKYPGLNPQRRALEAGEKESGCTVHFVDAGMDTGPIILQARVPIEPGDTEERLAERILAEEHRIYPEAVRRVLRGEVRP